MLVLSRNSDDSIIIGNNEIKITVLSINRGQVKIGIEAPKSIPVHRLEVYELIKANQKNSCPSLNKLDDTNIYTDEVK